MQQAWRQVIRSLLSGHPHSLALRLEPFPLCLTFTPEAPKMSKHLAPGRWSPSHRWVVTLPAVHRWEWPFGGAPASFTAEDHLRVGLCSM